MCVSRNGRTTHASSHHTPVNTPSPPTREAAVERTDDEVAEGGGRRLVRDCARRWEEDDGRRLCESVGERQWDEDGASSNTHD